MNFKSAVSTLAMLSLSTGLFAQNKAVTAFPEDVRQALKGAADKACASIAASRIAPSQAVSVFFIEGDDASGYVSTLVRDAVVGAGRTYVVPNDDDNRLLQKIYSEMAFDERKVGAVDAKTVERINDGLLKSTQVLLYGTVWTVVDNDRYTLVEMSLGAYSIATKEFLWAGSFDCRHFKPGKTPEVGLVDLPFETRATLTKTISAKVEQSINAQPRLKSVKTAAILPLVGDETASLSDDGGSLKAPPAGGKGEIAIDGYVTHVVVDGVSRTGVTPKNADVQTRAEVRRALRDKPQIADAVLFGAVRGLDIRVAGTAFRKTTYEVIVDVQLSIEEITTQNVLWSDTILVRETLDSELSWWEWLMLDYPGISRPKFFVGLLGRIVLALVALAILGKILRASTRVR